jgi:LysM repeat protein
MATNVTIDSGVNITTAAQRKLIDVVKKANFPFTVRVTSASRSEPGSFHDTSSGLAIDFAVGSSMNDDNSRKMREVARLFYKYPTHLRELIHTTPFSDDNGFYVQFEQLRGPDYFGAATNAAHLNHVHVAALLSEATYIYDHITPLGGVTPPAPTPTPPGGTTVATDAEWIKTALDKGVRTGGSQTAGGGIPSMWLARRLKELEDQNKELLALLKEIQAAILSPKTYIVVAGDTLSEIAVKYNTTVEEVKRLNGLTSDTIHPGDVLRVK